MNFFDDLKLDFVAKTLKPVYASGFSVAYDSHASGVAPNSAEFISAFMATSARDCPSMQLVNTGAFQGDQIFSGVFPDHFDDTQRFYFGYVLTLGHLVDWLDNSTIQIESRLVNVDQSHPLPGTGMTSQLRTIQLHLNEDILAANTAEIVVFNSCLLYGKSSLWWYMGDALWGTPKYDVTIRGLRSYANNPTPVSLGITGANIQAKPICYNDHMFR